MFNRYDSDLTLWKNIQQHKSENALSQHIMVDDSFDVQHVHGISQRSGNQHSDGDNGNERVSQSYYWLFLIGLLIIGLFLGC